MNGGWRRREGKEGGTGERFAAVVAAVMVGLEDVVRGGNMVVAWWQPIPLNKSTDCQRRKFV